MTEQREQFGSRLGFILAAAGSAVGIGNMVGFPVAATKNGGGAFLLTYAIFVFFVCLPVMMAEMSAGRRAGKDPLGTYNTISEGETHWRLAGALAVITPFMIGVFYTVITVWLFGYLVHVLSGDLASLAEPGAFGAFINSNEIFYYMIAVAAIVFLILQGGVKNGIERASKILMPGLFFMLVGLMVFVLTLDNAMAGVEYYLVPDFSKLNASVVSGALSQAFFSLSLGMGILLTYGSYLSKRNSVPGSAKLVALADTCVAFVAGLMLLPAVFSFNPDVNVSELSDSSVGMIFTFLPKIFVALQSSIGYTGASAVAAVFFLLVLFAAITSLVSIIEVPTAALMDERNMSRRKALLTLGVLIGILAILSATSFGMLPWFTEFTEYAGVSKSFFDVIVDVFYETILPLNGLLICLLVTYRWKKRNFNQELHEGDPGYKGTWLERYVDFSLGTFIPVILAAVFINTVAIKYFGVALIG
ncbi:putative sodium-dependent transporter YocR [Saliniradius amylolyticus]|uniref:Putative sodium-dependent transporter YocR n=1 Tax=Saliniradius amylolyticus TaxID=2183582 RepID=A0A2S2DZR3_9ALTE|nr:sodium-dependent transporter [Saliniradius amylolyticus]AWL10888.1 putative sodium-dependent transporter YocR [Saliniradius amylolyticus]